MQTKTNIRQVLINKAKAAAASFVITPQGKEYFEYHGDRIKPEHFALMFPTKLKNLQA